MVKIYTSPSCSSCRKVKKWFKDQKIPFIEKNIFGAPLDENDLKEILIKSDNGTEDIISPRSKIIKESGVNIDNMTVKELIEFIRQNPSILKRPIMLDDKKMQVGYNPDDISAFIPEARKLAEWACDNCPHASECDHKKDEA